MHDIAWKLALAKHIPLQHGIGIQRPMCMSMKHFCVLQGENDKLLLESIALRAMMWGRGAGQTHDFSTYGQSSIAQVYLHNKNDSTHSRFLFVIIIGVYVVHMQRDEVMCTQKWKRSLLSGAICPNHSHCAGTTHPTGFCCMSVFLCL